MAGEFQAVESHIQGLNIISIFDNFDLFTLEALDGDLGLKFCIVVVFLVNAKNSLVQPPPTCCTYPMKIPDSIFCS